MVLDNVLPTVDGIARGDASPTTASNITFIVAFSEPVSGVDGSDFTLMATGTATGTIQSLVQIGEFPQNFEVTIVSVSGDGTLRLDLNDTGTGITDLAGQSITNGFTDGEVYAIDSVVPAAPAFTGISEDTGVDGDLVTVDPTLILYGTAETNILVTLTLVGTGTIGSTNADISGNWSFDYTGTALPEGTNVFTAIASDGAGNVSASSANFTVVINSGFRLTLLSTPTVYAKSQPPVKLDTSAVLDPGEHTHFDGGRLSAIIVSNSAPEDALSIYNRGTRTNQIGVASNTVSFGSLVFAQITPAANASSPLVFTFNTNSTPAAVQALVRELSFVTSSSDTRARTVKLVLTDSLGSNTPPAHKTIVMNKAAKETFVTNPFPSFVGVFNGLVLQTNNIVPDQSGYFSLKVSTKLAYSGKLTIGGRRVSISGQINTNGQVSTFTSGQKWGVELELVEGTDQIRGRVTSYIGGGWTSDLFGYRQGFSKTEPAGELARSYTLRLPENTDPDVAILGHGHASIVVNSAGQAKLKGLLADGQKWSQSSLLSTNGHCPIYVSLDRNLGEIIGWVQFSNTASNAFSGALTWIKPASAPFFTNGIAAELDATGSRYLPPSTTNDVLSWTNGLLRASLGNLPEALTNSVTITTLGKFTDNGGSFANLKFKLASKTGLFSGSFTHPATGRTTKYYGGLLQDRNDGAGFFLGTNVGGILRLDEAP